MSEAELGSGEDEEFYVFDEKPCKDVNDILAVFNDFTLRIEIRFAYSLYYFMVFVVGLVGNGLLIAKIRRQMTVANVFLINLAISDLLLCITALPITPVLAFIKRWIFGNLMCKLVSFCQGVSVLISTYCLCLIAVDRYRSIVTPLKVPWTVRQAQFFMAICWLGAIFASMPLFIAQELQHLNLKNITLCGEFCGEFNWPADQRLKLVYGSGLLIMTYLVPVSIISFCYWKILQKVRQDWVVNTGSMLTEAAQAHTSERKRRVMYVLMFMVFVFIGSWMPLTICNILRDFGVPAMEVQMYFKLLTAHACAMSSIVWNPLLYFWMSKRHRRALKDDMFWLTNVRRQHQMGLLEKFAPSPSVGIMYRKSLERHLLNQKYNPYSFRRGTLADPTMMSRERTLQEMHANCFLLVPLMPLCVPTRTTSTGSSSEKTPSMIFKHRT